MKSSAQGRQQEDPVTHEEHGFWVLRPLQRDSTHSLKEAQVCGAPGHLMYLNSFIKQSAKSGGCTSGYTKISPEYRHSRRTWCQLETNNNENRQPEKGDFKLTSYSVGSSIHTPPAHHPTVTPDTVRPLAEGRVSPALRIKPCGRGMLSSVPGSRDAPQPRQTQNHLQGNKAWG